MKIDLFNIEEFIELNDLKEVTSPILFQRGDVPHPNGLVSNEIFGVTTKSRKETFAYIDLHGHFFHPHVYKIIKRFFRNIEKIVNGDMYYSIDSNGNLVPDENGETGIEFLYNNWERIKWKYSEGIGMRNERIDVITKFPKNEVFMKYQLVIPAFYRDITTSSKGGQTDDINKMYAKLIRMGTLVRDRDLFDFQFHITNYNIQTVLVEIYDYFKGKLEKKNGLIRKYLMGKNVDYCTRTVITCSSFHAEKAEDLMVNMRYSCVPISQVVSLCYPFVLHWLKNFFEREIFDEQHSKIFYDPLNDEIKKEVTLLNPESYFNEKYFKRMIDTFIKDPTCRFNKIEVPTSGKTKLYLAFTGKRINTADRSELSTISNRPMTWTDLLYMACSDAVDGKHCMVTRYPLLDEFGIFLSRVRVSSTTKTDVVNINGKIYNWYPHIDFNVEPDKIAVEFIDSVQFSNSYLPGLDGDFDGDQCTVKIIFTQEANEECERVMNNKAFFINSMGQNIRKIENEATQTFFTMTKEPKPGTRILDKEDTDFFVNLSPEDITFSKLVEWFGDTVDITNNSKHAKKSSSKYNCTDIIKISNKDYRLVDGEITTTLGRLIYTKIISEGIGLDSILGFINYQLDDDGVGKIEDLISSALKEDKITVEQMYKFVDTRDWLGLQFHSVITTSFTPGVLRVPPEVVKLKKELLKKYEKELANGDEKISELVETTLVKKAREILKDDVGSDLYISGARGSYGNNYKNMYLMRGAIKNNSTGKYDIVTNSLTDGLDKKDMAAHSNSITNGAYPKAVGTKDSGYLAKELLAALQTEVLAEDGSDCGTKGYITITIPKKTSQYDYRYIIENDKLVCLTPDIIRNYIGKSVKLRTPMYCIGVGKSKHICSKCAGEFYHKLNKPNIGLVSSRVATTCTRLNMKKFHIILIKSHKINVDDMIL